MKPEFKCANPPMIYLDNAATTFIDEEVLEAMEPYLGFKYGNPETVYELGRFSKEAVEASRANIADILKCSPSELFFTSGGTEANNLAIKGFLNGGKGIIVSDIEHSSVLEPARWVCDKNSIPFFKLPVDKYGLVNLKILEKELKTGKYSLVSIQYANNEIGTVQDVKVIADIVHKYGAVFHCDAVQAFGKIKFDVDDVEADMISISAHKIHGPMGVGALYVRKGTNIEPLMHGGGQESGMRSGTLAVPEIVGFGKAAEIAVNSIAAESKRLTAITEWLAVQTGMFFKAERNGHATKRLPNIVSMTFPKMEAEVVCGILSSRYGTCVSSCAACETSKRKSHVLEAIGRDPEGVLSTIRFSLSRFTTDSDVKLVYCNLQNAYRDAKNRELI